MEDYEITRLKDRVAIITGAGSGIGKASALLFAKEGARVVVADAAKGEETVRLIKEAGGEATSVRVDVSKATDTQRMVRTAIDSYGKLDILFNNAGMEGVLVRTAEISEEDWDRIISVNLKGVFSHNAGTASYLFRCFPFHSQGGYKGCDLGRSCLTTHYFFHHTFSFTNAEV